MQKPLLHIIHKNSFWLSAERCMYWEEEKALIVADMHFGKTGHFRKAGIAVPQTIYKEDLQRLVSQLQHFKPEKLIVAGDLFHSDANKELELFKKWRKDFSYLKIHLVKGNHDVLHDEWYKKEQIEINNGELIINNFYFVHDLTGFRLPTHGSQYYTLSGHIHPGIYISGAGKQSFRFPCFYFAKDHAVLPAFSRFTGTHLMEPKKGDKVFAIADNKIVQVA
ncbi:MAG TPA: ligase-associated DNA damage response endonuclease PdeM [Chitinophagaceae bacterium]|nr:ligase-associated DNA damage response endonuclease PdeM [Chitinophagaceae bacterium]